MIKHYTQRDFISQFYDQDKEDYKIKIEDNLFEEFNIFHLLILIIHKKNLFYFEGDKIIDVLCHGEYENNQTLSFTDVHRDFIRRGIARELINELNNYIDMKRHFLFIQVN